MTIEKLTYQSVAWMQRMKDKDSGKEYYMLGPVDGMVKTLAVTPVGGDGRTLFFCQIHEHAYGLQEVCAECRNAVHEVPTEEGVTSCDTP